MVKVVVYVCMLPYSSNVLRRDVNGFPGPEFITRTRVVKYPNLPDP